MRGLWAATDHYSAVNGSRAHGQAIAAPRAGRTSWSVTTRSARNCARLRTSRTTPGAASTRRSTTPKPACRLIPATPTPGSSVNSTTRASGLCRSPFNPTAMAWWGTTAINSISWPSIAPATSKRTYFPSVPTIRSTAASNRPWTPTRSSTSPDTPRTSTETSFATPIRPAATRSPAPASGCRSTRRALAAAPASARRGSPPPWPRCWRCFRTPPTRTSPGC